MVAKTSNRQKMLAKLSVHRTLLVWLVSLSMAQSATVNVGFDQPLQPKAEQTSVAKVQGNRAHRSRVMEQDQEGQASTLV
jgi:hypothetical protein